MPILSLTFLGSFFSYKIFLHEKILSFQIVEYFDDNFIIFAHKQWSVKLIYSAFCSVSLESF